MKLARKKGDCVTEAIVRARLDVDGVYDEHIRSVAAAAPPVDLSKLAVLRTLKGHSGKFGVRRAASTFCSIFDVSSS